jgi:Uma2 family endonuclease
MSAVSENKTNARRNFRGERFMNVNMADILMPKVLPERTKSVRFHIELEDDAPRMTVDEFWEFCQANRKFRSELTKDGDLNVMPPTGFETSDRNLQILLQLGTWANKDNTGKATESNAGFILPNGATYAPDAAWTSKKRLEKFTEKEKEKFLPLCPDFVIELRSSSDSLKELKAKMQEYIENGARLGWLINPKNKQVFVYHPKQTVEILENPATVSGEPVLKGFELDLTEIW